MTYKRRTKRRRNDAVNVVVMWVYWTASMRSSNKGLGTAQVEHYGTYQMPSLVYKMPN